MPVILSLLGTIVTILILLNRLADAGIDLGGLNPFLWHRRRKWRQKMDGNPIYHVENPMEVTALLMVAVAKSDGDMSSEEKHRMLTMFQQEFRMSKRDASDLMVASVYLLRDGAELRDNLEKVLSASLAKFSIEQATSAIDMISEVSRIDNAASDLKQQMLTRITACLTPASREKGKWE